MVQRFKLIAEYIPLLNKLIKFNLYQRYHGTALGFFWSFLSSLSMMIIFTFVFKYVLRIQIKDFTLFLFCAYIPWVFFNASIINACNIFLKHKGILEKIYFPREILVFSEILAHFLVFLASFSIFIIFFCINGKIFLSYKWLLLPFIMLLQIIFTIAIAFFLSIAQVFFRDISHIIEILLTIWFYLTPIFYPLKWVPEKMRLLVKLNPMTMIISGYRYVFFNNKNFNFLTLNYYFLVGIILFFLGWIFLIHHEKKIIEIL